MLKIAATTRVVVAYDHPVAILGIKVLMDEQDTGLMVVGQAVSGVELLALLTRVACDLLIIDVSMLYQDAPQNGLLLLDRLRREHPVLPIIVISTMRDRALTRGMLNAGVNAVVGKVAMVKELILATAAVRNGRTYLSESLCESATGGSRTVIEGPFVAVPECAPSVLSKREAEIVRLYSTGYSVTQISERVHRSVKTISQQKNDAMRKLGLTNNSQLHEYARLARLG